MRITVTLDAEVAAALNRAVRRHPKRSKKAVVNELLRVGLGARKHANVPIHFQLKTYRMGLIPGLNYDDVWGLMEK